MGGKRVEGRFWANHFRSMRDYMEGAMAATNHVYLRRFVAMLYEYLAARNALIFKERETQPRVVYRGACALV